MRKLSSKPYKKCSVNHELSCKLIYVIKNIHRISFNPHELEEVSIQTKFRGKLKPNFIKCLNYYEFKYF